MDKRTFMKTSSALIAGAALSPLTSCGTTVEEEPLKNWAGNLTFSTKNVHYPTSVEEIQELVTRLPSIRALGSRHSFSTIADSKQHLVATEALNQIVSLDKEAKTLTVEAGVRYGDICEYIHDRGFALHNLASLPHISIAGSGATSTHGSGVNHGGLATAVRAIEIVNANGDIINLSRESNLEMFTGAVVNLGALGIVTKVTLDLLPTFNMSQVVYRNMPMAALASDFESIMSIGYSVSLFTDWRNKNVNQVWIKSRSDASTIEPGKEFYGAALADREMHPVDDHPSESCTEQGGVDGPWHARLPHFKMGFTPSSGDELQAEFIIPFENGYEGMMIVEKMNEEISPHLLVSEIRTIAPDDFWMSPFYKKPCVAIHFTWKPHGDAVYALLPKIEEVLSPFGVRPHWGKLTTIQPSVLQSRIEKLSDFKELMNEFDPKGKFRNDYINTYLFS